MLVSALFLLSNFLAMIGCLFIYNFYWKRRKLPPGPIPLPLIGNLHSMRTEMAEQCFLRWSRKYGDLFTFWLGETPIVCLTNYEQIMETFQKDGESYAGRITNEEWEKIIKGGVHGVIFTEGEIWRDQRRFTLQVLRDFGLGKNLMQERILNELELMRERIDREKEGEEIHLNELFDIAIGSVINNLLFGYSFDDSKIDEFREIKELLRQLIKSTFNQMNVVFMHLPHLYLRLPYFSGIIKQNIEVNKNLIDFFARQIEAHKKVVELENSDSSPNDMVEAFLREKARRDATGEEHKFTDLQLIGLCNDIWVAGQETTSTTLAWGIAYLIHHPEVQAKLHAELDQLTGEDRSRMITVADRPKLPYMNATINEIHRVANLVAINVTHKLTKNVVINGYSLPKGLAIAPQISAVLMNEEIFKNPNEFRPERFLDEHGKLKKVEELIPFSVGKRQCLGESLARMEMFLFLSNLLNQYKFMAGEKMPSLERKMGGAIPCPPFKCRIQKRSARQ